MEMDDQIYEINIKRFIQSTDFQLKKLGDCINRLHEFQSYEDWTNVKQAQLNASQIIKRIKSDIKEIEKIRGQVGYLSMISKVSDQEKRGNPIVEKIDQQLKEITQRLKVETDEIEALGAPYHRVEIKNQSLMIESSYDGPEMYNYQIEKDEFVTQDKDLCYAYEQLQKDCEDLKYIMDAFSHELFKQRETIDSIERNVQSTQENVDSGSHSLRKALTYKSLGTAAGGAVIGTLVGGPVGFIAGAKLGAVVGLSGGVAGYFLGKYINTPSRE